MPASGKSTQARLLAQMLGYAFVDMDKALEAQEKMTISEIFRYKGESYFREMERVALHQVLKLKNTVIAMGGGTPCFYDNIKRINANSVSIYLKNSLEVLSKRIYYSPTSRPMFLGKTESEILEMLEKIFAQRKEFYEQATFFIESELPKITV